MLSREGRRRQKKNGALPKFRLRRGTAKNLCRNKNMKVRRVDYIPHATHSRISPLQFKISGLSPEATLRTVAYVAGVLLGVPSSSEGSDHTGTRDPTSFEVLASAFVCDGEGAVVTQASARWREHCASRRCQRASPASVSKH